MRKECHAVSNEDSFLRTSRTELTPVLQILQIVVKVTTSKLGFSCATSRRAGQCRALALTVPYAAYAVGTYVHGDAR
jgi:hypothetical protein